jgi:parvulin-like peptidyl-prolyl isomerase
MKTMALRDLYVSMGAQNMQDLINAGDMPEYWAMPVSETESVGDRLKTETEHTLKQFLAIAAYCKEHKLDLSREQRDNIDKSIKSLIDSDKYRRSKANLNAVLIRFNIDDSILKEIRRLEELTGVFARHAFPEGSGTPVTDDMINMFYEETCSRVKHILVKYSPGQLDDEIQARIDNLYNRVTAGGEDFDSLLSESADGMPFEGYTIRSDTPFVPEFLHAAFDMQIGEVRKVETSHGMHIIKRYELLPPDQAINLNTYESWRDTIVPEIQQEFRRRDMMDILKPYMDKIEMNRAETDLFDIASSAIMFDCMEITQ